MPTSYCPTLRFRTGLGLLVLGLAGADGLGAQSAPDPVLASRAAAQAAQEAYARHDLTTFLARSREAVRLRPDHGGVLYALASACALSGDTAGALDALERFAGLGYAADVAADSDLVRLRALPRFDVVRRRLEENAAPMVRADTAFTLIDRDLLTEGLAYDSVSRSFFVGSVRHRKILRVGPSGRPVTFVTSAAQDMWAPLGLRVDPVRRWLWAAVAAVPQMIGYDSALAGRSGLMAFDLGTGAVRARYLLPSDGRPHALGDVLVADDGEVYASDSRAPVVFRVRPAAKTAPAGLEPWVSSPLLLSAQGMALDRDERMLYLADYSRGMLRIDRATRDIHVLPSPGLSVLGIDGLYRAGDDLIGVQNGVAPARVVRLRLDPTGTRIVATEALERARPDYGEPTLGTVAGTNFYYIANSQWEQFPDDGSVAEPGRLRRPLILRLPLSPAPPRR